MSANVFSIAPLFYSTACNVIFITVVIKYAPFCEGCRDSEDGPAQWSVRIGGDGADMHREVHSASTAALTCLRLGFLVVS